MKSANERVAVVSLSEHERRVFNKQLVAARIDVLRTLTDRELSMVLMRAHNHTFSNIARALAINESTARVLFTRLKNKCKARMKELGFDDDCIW